MDANVCRAYDTACDLAVSIEAPQLCVDICVFADGRGAFDFYALFRLDAFKPGKALPCVPKK